MILLGRRYLFVCIFSGTTCHWNPPPTWRNYTSPLGSTLSAPLPSLLTPEWVLRILLSRVFSYAHVRRRYRLPIFCRLDSRGLNLPFFARRAFCHEQNLANACLEQIACIFLLRTPSPWRVHFIAATTNTSSRGIFFFLNGYLTPTTLMGLKCGPCISRRCISISFRLSYRQRIFHLPRTLTKSSISCVSLFILP